MDMIDLMPPGCAILSQTDRERSEESPLHRHPHGEFFVLRSGHLVSATEAARLLIPPGQAYWVPPGTPHGGSLRRISGIRLHVSAALARGLCPEVPVAFSATPLVEALMGRWAVDASAGLPPRAVDRHMFAVLADEMANRLTQPLLLPMPGSPVMRRVLAAWSETCDERASLDLLAERCRMSRRSFTRRFRIETGMSPGTWMQAARILRGCQLMASGTSITDTAFMLGFESPASFFNLCRRLTGLNPSALMRRL
ncbi:AraC family transcriptional regulator [Rhizosaccharibacter radicis]|uniref:AraC family transcriptional regulator n=1 Tax=Rhizosaccharibacter radicis TaxID=2782605 RepID=A0ABT1W1F0_9PROT|nr:AraC family transcriptional regulator [Acetobacteraceae bacterium KSS12]